MTKFSDILQLYPHSIAFSNDAKNPSLNHYEYYKPLYDIVNICLANDYAVIYGAEYLDKSDELSNTINKDLERAASSSSSSSILSNSNNEISNNIGKGLLIIVNADSSYSDKRDGNGIINYWMSNFSKTKKILKDKDVKGIFSINIPDPYLSRDKHDFFMKFETDLGKNFKEGMGMLCWHNKKWLADRTLQSLIRLLTIHNMVLYHNFQYKRWTLDNIIEIIKNVIDREYGNENDTTTLLFETIRHAYHLDKEALLLNSDFENILSKTIGNDDYYNIVRPAILKEIKKEILFDKEIGK
jgi:hypothetical protein